ncbi:MAG: hypothetical protein KDI62_10675 [Anaerolineae bacterium]|nr:hypothetical protein [Anaerolineae bacterium]
MKNRDFSAGLGHTFGPSRQREVVTQQRLRGLVRRIEGVVEDDNVGNGDRLAS